LKMVGPNGFVLTEAGFGADIGAEKFYNIKCRYSNLVPDAAVLASTPRALKYNGGGREIVAGQETPIEYRTENLELLAKGCSNLEKQIKNAAITGLPVVLALSHIGTQKEIDYVLDRAKKAGAFDAVYCRHWEEGGIGAVKLAEAVVKATQKKSQFKFLYELNQPLTNKIETIATKVYGASGVEYSDKAKQQIERCEKQGWGNLPVCMSKTQYSLSHDPALKGAPTGFKLPIREIRQSIGAGFITAMVGAIQTLPGLPTRPAFFDIDIDLQSGKIIGLS